MELKKNSMHMDMFFPDNLIYEMKPIHEIQTQFTVFRKQNTYVSNTTTNKGAAANPKRDNSTMQIRETNLVGARTLSKNMSSISSEPLDLDLRGLEKFYDKKNNGERKYQLAKNKRVQ